MSRRMSRGQMSVNSSTCTADCGRQPDVGPVVADMHEWDLQRVVRAA